MESGAVRIGTSSWCEKSLIASGRFYPSPALSPEERLRFYACHFDTVEVNSSYYAIPTPHMTQAWAERTPPRFLFHVRAYGALTGHGIDAAALRPELREMLPAAARQETMLHVSDPSLLRALAQAMVASLAPLKSAGKLGFVIFQFPPWFSCKKANREYLLYCKELMAGLPIAVEFRHGSWLAQRHADDLFAFLREYRITYITCDEPQYPTSVTVPFRPEATTSVAYLRLHGRSGEERPSRSCPGMAEYRYRTEELQDLALHAKGLSAKARTVFVMFNNCHGGHAVRDALKMQDLIFH